MKNLTELAINSINQTRNEQSNLTGYVTKISGMTDQNAQMLINNVCSNVGGHYLEIGTHFGATFCSAICNTSLEVASCMDYYTEVAGIGGLDSLQNLIGNIRNTPHTCSLQIFDYNVYKFDFNLIKKVDILFYDGPHEYDNAVKNFHQIYNCLNDEFVLLVDDYKDKHQSAATQQFIKDKQIQIDFSETFPYYRGVLLASCKKT